MVNGFGNRFCWFMVRRSQELPFPSAPSERDLSALAKQIGQVLLVARTGGALQLAERTRDAWAEIYHDLSADRPGMAGSLLGRAEAQVMRLAALYACLDGQATIDLVHLRAALAVWQHAEDSTRMIFGDSLGDPVADTMLRALRASGDLTDSQLSNLFDRHVSVTRLDRAKQGLLQAGLAHCVMVETAGRPRIVWSAGAKKAN
jgi:hypothetical protein